MNAPTAEAPAQRAGFWQRTAGWTLDAALLAPPALLLAWPWTAAPLQAVAAHWDALLHITGTAMAQALLRAQDEIAGLPSLALALVHDPTLREAIARLSSALWAAVWPPLLAFALLGAAWQVGFERSSWQASPGRRVLGLYVEDSEGRRLSARRALARHLAGALSWLTLNIGHLMAAAAPRHLAMHDRVSDTRVRSARAGLPGWAAAWLVLTTLASLALFASLVGNASVTMRGALEAALW